QANNQCFNRQPQKLTNPHCFHAGTHLIQSGCNVDVGASADHTGCTGDYILSDVEYCHHNVKGVGYEVDRHSRLKEPLEKHPCIHVVKVVLFGDHGNQLVTQHKGDDDTGNRDNDCLGQSPNHRVDAVIP